MSVREREHLLELGLVWKMTCSTLQSCPGLFATVSLTGRSSFQRTVADSVHYLLWTEQEELAMCIIGDGQREVHLACPVDGS